MNNRDYNKEYSKDQNGHYIKLDAEDKLKIKHYANAERMFYNSLVMKFSTKIKTNPSLILGIKDDWENLFKHIVMKNISSQTINTERKTGEYNLLKDYKDIVESKDKNENLLLNDEMIEFITGVNSSSLVHPNIRSNIFDEQLSFYKKQALLYKTAKDSDENIFTTHPEFLDVVDDIQKRHIQIPRELIKLGYDDEYNVTWFEGAYWKTPFSLEGDYVKNNWNLCILHQEPGKIAVTKTPWMVHLRKTKYKYILKYLDMVDPRMKSTR